MQAVIDNHEFVRFEHGAHFHAVFFVVPYRDDHARSWPAADRPWTPDEFDPGGPLNGGSLLLLQTRMWISPFRWPCHMPLPKADRLEDQGVPIDESENPGKIYPLQIRPSLSYTVAIPGQQRNTLSASYRGFWAGTNDGVVVHGA
jgi:hypothetical protein